MAGRAADAGWCKDGAARGGPEVDRDQRARRARSRAHHPAGQRHRISSGDRAAQFRLAFRAHTFPA